MRIGSRLGLHVKNRSRRVRRWVVAGVVTTALGVSPLVALPLVTASAPPAAGSGCTVSSILVPSCGAWWGAYVPATGSALPSAVASLESQLGRRLGLIYAYHDMSNQGDNGVFPTPAEEQLGKDHLMLFSWTTDLWSSGSHYNWSQVASGSLDKSVIDPEALRLKAYGKPVFLTFDPEADERTPQDGTPAQFVAAWRHIHDRFAALGVSNVIWVWTTTGYLGEGNAPTIAALYPGDAYVDWIGYDPYNFYTCHSATWTDFDQTISPFYNWLESHGHGNKPFMMPEYSTAPNPSNPALEQSWYSGMVAALKAHPNIKALSQWDSTVPGCNLTLTNGPGVLQAFATAGQSPYLQPALPASAGGSAPPTSGAPTPTGPAPTVSRLAGTNRLGTAVAVSQSSFPNAHSASAVVLARDNLFPDALVGAPLAAAKHGPLLLTDPESLTSVTQAEISRVLAPGGNVYVLGGDLAISPAISSELTSMGYHVVRLAGANRYGTAVQVASALGNPSTVFEVTGANFPDALSAGPAAVASQGAILLTDGYNQAAETAHYLSQHQPKTTYAVGGPACHADPAATCVMGQDRYGTAAAVAGRFFPSSSTVGLATGLVFPDALTAGPLLGAEKAPMILVSPNVPLPSAVQTYLGNHAASVTKVEVFGGDLAVSPSVVRAIP